MSVVSMMNFNSGNSNNRMLDVDSILSSNQMTRKQYLELMSVLLSGRDVTEEDCRKVNQVFDRVYMGRIRLIDASLEPSR